MVQYSEFRGWGLAFRVQGLSSRVKGWTGQLRSQPPHAQWPPRRLPRPRRWYRWERDLVSSRRCTGTAAGGAVPNAPLHRKLPAGGGGVNHCHLHCHLANFRDLMIRTKHGATIG